MTGVQIQGGGGRGTLPRRCGRFKGGRGAFHRLYAGFFDRVRLFCHVPSRIHDLSNFINAQTSPRPLEFLPFPGLHDLSNFMNADRYVDPLSLHYTKAQIPPRFDGCHRPLKEVVAALHSGTHLNEDDLPPMKVFADTVERWETKTKSKKKKNGSGKKETGSTGTGGQKVSETRWYSLDNRRLWVFQQAGYTSVPVHVVEKPPGWKVPR